MAKKTPKDYDHQPAPPPHLRFDRGQRFNGFFVVETFSKGSLNVHSTVGSVQLEFSSVEFNKCNVQCAVGNEVCSVGSI